MQTLEEAVQAVKQKAKMQYKIDLQESWLREILPSIMKTEPTTSCQVTYLAYVYGW